MKIIRSKNGEERYNWKGGDVGYRGLHRWVSRWFGKAVKCSNCDNKDDKRYYWANKSGQYKREFLDWIELCSHCHRCLDYKGYLPKWE